MPKSTTDVNFLAPLLFYIKFFYHFIDDFIKSLYINIFKDETLRFFSLFIIISCFFSENDLYLRSLKVFLNYKSNIL